MTLETEQKIGMIAGGRGGGQNRCVICVTVANPKGHGVIGTICLNVDTGYGLPSITLS